MLGALICSRLVVRLGTNNTLTMGVFITLIASISQWLASLTQTPPVVTLAASSCMIFFGIGLTSANASMGAVSLFPKTAGAASAVFGFVHATTAAAVGFLAGQLYNGTLLPTTSIMLACAVAGIFGIPLARNWGNASQLSKSS
jgi:DHA1 family bicyclomycin/chloramphenicol resistance-like MFS transporter